MSDVATISVILSRLRILKALIRLRGCISGFLTAWLKLSFDNIHSTYKLKLGRMRVRLVFTRSLVRFSGPAKYVYKPGIGCVTFVAVGGQYQCLQQLHEGIAIAGRTNIGST